MERDIQGSTLERFKAFLEERGHPTLFQEFQEAEEALKRQEQRDEILFIAETLGYERTLEVLKELMKPVWEANLKEYVAWEQPPQFSAEEEPLLEIPGLDKETIKNIRESHAFNAESELDALMQKRDGV